MRLAELTFVQLICLNLSQSRSHSGEEDKNTSLETCLRILTWRTWQRSVNGKKSVKKVDKEQLR